MSILRAGTAKKCINPPLGSEMAGFIARKGKLQGVHDNLWAKSLVINNSSNDLVLISLDLIGLQSETIDEIRTALEQDLDINKKSIIISCTHTHSGPETVVNSANKGYLDLLKRNI